MSSRAGDAAWVHDRDPERSDYYLVAWRRGGSCIVSELWFNPDARPRWWWSRGYAGQRRGGMADAFEGEVIAWMPMPEPPEANR